MEMDWSESRREQSVEKDRDDSPMRELGDGDHDEMEENGTRESNKPRSKDTKKSSRREEKDHRGKDRERLKTSEKEIKDTEKDRVSSRERRKEDRDDRDKDRTRDKMREKDYDHRDKYKDKEREHERDKDRKDRGREKEREKDKDGDRGRDKERGKEKNRDRDKEREKERDRAKEKEREKDKEKYKDREHDKDRDKEKAKEKTKDKEREMDQEKEKSRDRDRVHKQSHEEDYDMSKDGGNDGKVNLDHEDSRDHDVTKHGKNFHHSEDEQSVGVASGGTHSSASDIMERISKMKGERLKKKSEDVPEVLAWVNKSRKLEEKRKAEKEKALHLSKIFEEQDNIVQGEDEDEDEGLARHTAHNLAGVKVLHGLDKVIEGGAVVLTLKDQSILADGDVNEEIDMLENVEIGQQKQRDEAYKAAKKKTGVYVDKFNEEPGSEKKMLPQYDDPVADEGITLDHRGRFTGEAEKKLEELRRRIQGASTVNRFEDLNSVGKKSTDYYSHEEMLQFKKPKKKKSLRKKDKLDIDALEAEAVSAGLGVGDLGARNDAKRQATKEEQARSEAEMRNNAYKLAYAKADEASKSLRLEQTLPVKLEEDEYSTFADDEDDLYKSLERARKLALKKQEESASGPEAIARLVSTSISKTADDENPHNGEESQENKVVFTEMDEFVWGLQLDEEARKPDSEDVFMDEDEAPKVFEQEQKDETGGWTAVEETAKEEHHVKENKEDIVPDETIHEAAVGKGLSGALKLLKERGTLKESIEWGGRNMDKKKSKLVGIADNDGPKEIHIERLDEFGRIMTPKEAFRMISHKFHGKGPGKMKQEKRQKQYYEELKLKGMKNSDTPSMSVERMREAQAQLKTPYLVLSGHVRPGQTSDPRSGFATVEKDLPGGLTPMLGDRKVEHFLGIKRKAEPDNPKKPKK